MTAPTNTGTSTGTGSVQAREDMVHAMCANVDRGEAGAFGAWFAADASYRFGSAEPVAGREAVVAVTHAAIDSMPWVKHTVEQVAQVGDQLFCRFTIESENSSGARVAMPCVTVIWMDNKQERVVDYRVHMDLSPLQG